MVAKETELKPTRPVLRYHGGKHQLAAWIISHFPQHVTYTETFGGAASVLLQKPRSDAEVYNDLNGDLVNLFQVLRDRTQARELIRQLALTPFAYAEYRLAKESCADPIERARRMVVASFMSVGTDATTRQGGSGFRNYSKAANMGRIPARQWADIPANVVLIVERLQGVIIEQRAAIHVLKQHDSCVTLHYVDPPYVHATRGPSRGTYKFELADDEHYDLAAVLHDLAGMVVLSGYPCELYDKELYLTWHRVERPALADGARPRTEVLWLNEQAWTRLQANKEQRGLFTPETDT